MYCFFNLTTGTNIGGKYSCSGKLLFNIKAQTKAKAQAKAKAKAQKNAQKTNTTA